MSTDYLEKISETAYHIKECATFLGEQAGDTATDLEADPDMLQFAKDLIHTITTDVRTMTLLMDNRAPETPWRDGPYYVRMESRILTPEETEAHMRETLTAEEFAEWSKPLTAEQQIEADEIEEGLAEEPPRMMKHLRGTRTDLKRDSVPVSPLDPEQSSEHLQIDEFGDRVTVVDGHGIPDHIINPQEVLEDAWSLALGIGASRGDQTAITEAISGVLDKWDPHAGYVLSSALTQLGRDLIPMVADLAKASTGVDFAKHCQAMQGLDYDPNAFDIPRDR